MSVFFTSDLHFGHKNVIRHSNRPYTSVEEHDEQIISRWNEMVPRGRSAVVYVLGDMFFCKKQTAETILNRLNGRIRLILGNHDKTAKQLRDRFEWVKDTSLESINGQRIWMSHYQHATWPELHYGAWHIWGHTHNHTQPNVDTPSIDVGVDAHDYRPWAYEELRDAMLQRVDLGYRLGSGVGVWSRALDAWKKTGMVWT